MSGPTISTLVTNCSARKTVPSASLLTFHDLPQGTQASVAAQWVESITRASPSVSASELYCGRGVIRMRRLAARIGAKFFIVSAGLGLIRGDRRVPSYDLSVSTTASSAVQKRIVGRFSAPEWWAALEHNSYAESLNALFAGSQSGLVLIAVSGSYVSLIAQPLSQLKEQQRKRLRLFGAQTVPYPPVIQSLLMPYDCRLDTLVPGAKLDFAQRAAEHFVNGCISNDAFPTDLEPQREWVASEMERGAQQAPQSRRVASDAEIRAIAAELAAQGIGQTRALAILRRDRQIACEQSRFRRLFTETTK